MPTSSYMPDVVVQIAWDGGYRVPKTSWTWTDVSGPVELHEGLTITWGRQDERSTADANALQVTLDNSGGDFTPLNTSSAYYPNVVLYKPIRVLATPVDGAQSHRFLGYINNYAVEWDDETDAYSKVVISASSRLARLGLNAAWRSLIEETYLADSPVAYYPLGDPEGSTVASDVSGLGAAPLAMVGAGTDVVFGQATGPGTDGLTAATFAAGKYLAGSITPITPAGVTLETFVLSSAAPTAAVSILSASAGTSRTFLQLQTDGKVLAQVNAASSLTSTTNVCNGSIHHVSMTWDGTTADLYIDDVSEASSAIAGTPALGPEVAVGGFGGASFTGVLAHAAFFDSELQAAQVLAHATAGSTAFAGETTDIRFERYADMVDIPAAEVAAEAGSTTVAHIDTTDQQVVDLLRTIERTEAGVMFDARDGTLTLHNRAHRYAATAAVTLDFNKHEVEADYSPRLDPSALFNDISVTGATSAHLKNDASIAANGLATASITTASEDDDEPRNLAGWALLQFATPKPRVPTLTVNALAQVGKTVDCADVMAVTLGDKVTVTNHPAQAQATTSSYFVEGGSEVYGPESLTLTWNVTPSSPDDQVLIIDDATRGVIDTNVIGL